MTPNEIATHIWSVVVLFLGPLLSESLKKPPVLVQPGWESTKFPERPRQVGGGQADPENTDANNAGARAAAAAIKRPGQGEDAPVASAPPTPPNRSSLRFDLVPLPMDFPNTVSDRAEAETAKISDMVTGLLNSIRLYTGTINGNEAPETLGNSYIAGLNRSFCG